MDHEEFENFFSEITTFKKNPFHPLVWIVGEPKIGKNVYIGGMSEIHVCANLCLCTSTMAWSSKWINYGEKQNNPRIK